VIFPPSSRPQRWNYSNSIQKFDTAKRFTA
jgi:hypothetical protein